MVCRWVESESEYTGIGEWSEREWRERERGRDRPGDGVVMSCALKGPRNKAAPPPHLTRAAFVYVREKRQTDR